MSVITDGVDEVRRAAREELRKGATQLKIFATGGVVFPSAGTSTRYEFSMDELLAIVDEAGARSTYVMAHAYTDESIRRCLSAGVRSIEHGNYASEATIAMIAQHGAFLDPTFISLVERIETAAQNGLAPQIVENLKRTTECGKQVYAWARKHGVPIALGTDLWGPEAQQSQIRELPLRQEFDTPAAILHSATVTNAELLQTRCNRSGSPCRSAGSARRSVERSSRAARLIEYQAHHESRQRGQERDSNPCVSRGGRGCRLVNTRSRSSRSA